MFYLWFRAVSSLLFRLFFRVDAPLDPHGALALQGPVIFVGNHPNGLVDPGLVFILAKRRITFLAKAPLFEVPVLNLILWGMGALPVYRRQDDPSRMQANEGTLQASADALCHGGAITIFPEGKSHSDPQLAELKTGCARIALAAAARGAAVRVVPVGLTYEDKSIFRSRVRIEVGAPLDVAALAAGQGPDDADAVHRLTGAVADALEAVTLNLDTWDDLPLLETAEALYALRTGGAPRDPERLRAFARGLRLLRDEAPERFRVLRRQLLGYRRRLELVAAQAGEVPMRYRPAGVARFVARQVLALTVGLPLFLLGMAAFVVPYHVPLLVVTLVRPSLDTTSTFKVLTAFVVAPLWWAGLVAVGAWAGGWPWALLAAAGTLPLALFTRYYVEQRLQAVRDVRLFFTLASRRRLRLGLLDEGERLAAQLEALVQELRPRVAPETLPAAS